MMNGKKKFVIRNADILQRCIQFLHELPLGTVPNGWSVVIQEEKISKSREQEEKYHAMIGDIKASGKFTFMGRTDWTAPEIKSLLKEGFAAERIAQGNPLRHSAKLVPSLDGKRIVPLEPSSKEFTLQEASDFIEYLYAYGSELGVRWRG